MSERQVQYTDGSWSREVEVTDDLLDEVTRLMGDYREGRLLRALVERVRDAAQEAETQAGIAAIRTAERDSLRFELDGARAVARKDNEHLIAERDAARGKIDKVRQWAHHIRTTRQRGDIEYNAAADVLAILDGKTGD